jgi:uncharacterized protein YecE (DUF72 family)
MRFFERHVFVGRSPGIPTFALGHAAADLSRRAAVGYRSSDWRSLLRVTEVTSDFLYLRWLGERHSVQRFDRLQIDRGPEFEAWEADLKRALPQVREVYGYFNNHWAGHSPASANEMKRRLGLVVVDPRERWTQRELW